MKVRREGVETGSVIDMPTFLTGRVIEWAQAGTAPNIKVDYVDTRDVSVVSRENAGSGEAQLVAKYILDKAADIKGGAQATDYVSLLQKARDGLITVPLNEIGRSTPLTPSVM